MAIMGVMIYFLTYQEDEDTDTYYETLSREMHREDCDYWWYNREVDDRYYRWWDNYC